MIIKMGMILVVKKGVNYAAQILYNAVSHFIAEKSWAFASYVALSTLMAFLASFLGAETYAEASIAYVMEMLPEALVEPMAREIANVLTVRRGGLLTMSVIGAAYFAHIPSLLRDMLPWQGTLAIGVAFIPMGLVCLLVQLTQNRIEPFHGLWRGMVCLMLTCLCSILGALGAPWALIAGMCFLGAGQGYTFMCSATLANLNADPPRRAANMSTYFLSAYLGASVPIMILGRIADRIGLVPALTGYNLVFLLLVLAVAAMAYRQQRVARIDAQNNQSRQS